MRTIQSGVSKFSHSSICMVCAAQLIPVCQFRVSTFSDCRQFNRLDLLRQQLLKGVVHNPLQLLLLHLLQGLLLKHSLSSRNVWIGALWP